jgi:hypothetical protein
VAGIRHLVTPYSFDTNEMRFHQGSQRFVTAGDFAEYVTDAFDAPWGEGASAPRMLSIGLHLRMIGRPGRIAGLERGSSTWRTSAARGSRGVTRSRGTGSPCSARVGDGRRTLFA